MFHLRVTAIKPTRAGAQESEIKFKASTEEARDEAKWKASRHIFVVCSQVKPCTGLIDYRGHKGSISVARSMRISHTVCKKNGDFWNVTACDTCKDRRFGAT